MFYGKIFRSKVWDKISRGIIYNFRSMAGLQHMPHILTNRAAEFSTVRLNECCQMLP